MTWKHADCETLVVTVGEFGRTPKMGTDTGGNITGKDGRDHWVAASLLCSRAAAFAVARCWLATSTPYPAVNPFKPSDLGATVYSALGVDPASEVLDRTNRPMALNKGTPIAALFS